MPGPQVEITHADRVLFPDGTTKGDLAAYYRKIAPHILPHLRDRALMLQRFPQGVSEDGFYQKDVGEHAPDWLRTVEVPKEGGTVHHPICNDESTLAYIANQNCITIHSWLSRVDNLRRPDRMIFDLDPSDTVGFDTVRQAAYWLREILDEVELRCFVQTTGSRGLHVIVPLRPEADFDDVRNFARTLADVLASRYPEELTTQARKAARGDRLYLDVMRNAYAQTAVAPYSVRAVDVPAVATPLRWDDLADRELGPQRYTIHNVTRRLSRVRDPWRGFSRAARSLKTPIRRLEKVSAG